MKIRVAQCWDDGVYTDLRLVEILRKYDARATFNLNPGRAPNVTEKSRWLNFTDSSSSRPRGYKGFHAGKIAIGDFKKVYEGFMVASHCWNHETVGRVPDDVFVEAAVKARRRLEEIFEMPCPGFAWPCGVTSKRTIELMREAGFAYGRTTEYSDDVLDCGETLTFKTSCHFMDSDFMAKYKWVKTFGGAFYFWGHSYEMLDCEGLWDQFEQKIRFISEDPDAEWCDVIELSALCGGF